MDIPRSDPEPSGPVSIVVVYDSGSRGNPALRGRTEAVAKAIGEGAVSVSATRVTLIRMSDGDRQWADLDAADALVFGCPTYMGSGSAALKAFMEESLRPQWLEQRWKDKLAAGFTNSAGMSGDKLLTLHQLTGFAAQHGMLWITLGEAPGWQDSTGSPDDLNRLASFLGLMTQSNSDEGPDVAPPASDRATARRFGERIAAAAHGRRLGNTQRRGSGRSAALVLEAFGAVERRDREALEALFHPEVEFHWPPSLLARLSGHSWEKTWDPLQPTEADRRMSPRLVAASADEVVVLWHQRGLGQHGERLDQQVLGLYQVRDDKLARAQMFYFDTLAVIRFLAQAGAPPTRWTTKTTPGSDRPSPRRPRHCKAGREDERGLTFPPRSSSCSGAISRPSP
jgi:NAD(P)H dehydrogenase (quinone)